MGFSDWLWNKATEEWREVKRVPFTVAGVLLFGLSVGWYAADRFYSERFAVLQERLALAEKKPAEPERKPWESAAKNAVFITWGAIFHQLTDKSGRIFSTPPMPYGCSAVLNVRDLQEYKEKYRVVLACRAYEEGVDPFTSTQVRFSQPYTILETEMSVQTIYGRQTRDMVYSGGASINMAAFLVPTGVDPKTVGTISALKQTGAIEIGGQGIGISPPASVKFDMPPHVPGTFGVVKAADYWTLVDALCRSRPDFRCPPSD
jgi:hypothetical protein